MAGLLDFLQAASNEAAGTVSAPVDGLAWLLRKAGIPVNAPIGGSDWMEQRGLTRPVKQSAAQVAGATAGLLSPVAAAAKAPQIARGLLQAGDNLAAPSTIAGPASAQRGMALFDTSGMPDKGRHIIQLTAEEVADKLKKQGFQVDLQHSGSVIGPSSYLRVYDPTTGRFLKQTFRFSGHSKGPFESQFVTNVATPDEFSSIENAAIAMRNMGPSEKLAAIAQKEKAAQEQAALKLAAIEERAIAKQRDGIPLSNSERKAIAKRGQK